MNGGLHEAQGVAADEDLFQTVCVEGLEPYRHGVEDAARRALTVTFPVTKRTEAVSA